MEEHEIPHPAFDRKLRKQVAYIVLAVTAAILFGLYSLIQPGPSGVVASLQLPDGSQYMVTQHCNWSVEPYTVAFYMRSPGEPWGWCYIDHQSGRWRNAAMTYDPVTDIITVTREGVWQAALDRKLKTFAIGEGAPKRSLPAPQDSHDPGFPFPSSSK